jgi:hypothetical protein
LTEFETETLPHPGIVILDHQELGRLVVRWTFEPESRPASIEALRTALRGIAELPGTVRSFSFCEGRPDHLAIRLPAPPVIETAIERFSDPAAPLEYPIPQFYADHFHPGFSPILTPLDMLHARVGDCAFAEVR